jgi:hypothetical protein
MDFSPNIDCGLEGAPGFAGGKRVYEPAMDAGWPRSFLAGERRRDGLL